MTERRPGVAALDASAETIPTRDTNEKGRAIYNFRCYFCHGYSGDAKTLASSFLSPPPRSFVDEESRQLPRARMVRAVTEGKPNTAMMSFRSVLTTKEISAVVDFIRTEFMERRSLNTRYHTAENGWPNHEQYRDAYPFALNEVSLDTPLEGLTSDQRVGRQIFISSCISCHDRGRSASDSLHWEARPLSYPRNGYSNTGTVVDSASGATPYSVHDRAPQLAQLTAAERAGEGLFQRNCAFCHAADGTGKNWIGSFLESHPRNLRGDRIAALTNAQLADVIRNGIPGTTMSAWRSVLTDQEIMTIVAYVQRAFVAPPAKSPLK